MDSDAQDGAPPRSTAPTLPLDEYPDGVLVLGLDGRVTATNVAFLRMTGWSLSEVLGHPLEDLAAEEDMLRLVGFEAMFGGQALEESSVIFFSPEGGHRKLMLSSKRSADGQMYVLTVRPSELIQNELAATARWAAVEQERAIELAKVRDALVTKNAALRAAQDEVERAYEKLQSEVAAREQLEQELRLAQKLESIGQLAAGIAHEINTPMQYIGDNTAFLDGAFRRLFEYMELLGAAAASTEIDRTEIDAQLQAAKKRLRLDYLARQVPKALSDSKSGIEHVSNIVRAMKSFAHLDHEEKLDSDLNQAIRDTLIVAQHEYKSVANVETDLGELPPVRCVVSRVNQVFLNLIVNAVHAIADARREEPGLIRVTSRAFDNVVEIRVSDNGCGIPESIRHRVFDQFFTTKQVGRGTGQGLSIARNVIVDAHGGSITFESESGVGTTFIVRLPIDGRTRLGSAA
jgi:PAS domain S-box-containing protein